MISLRKMCRSGPSAAGEEFQFGRWGLQVELRWYEPNVATKFAVVEWVSLAGQGGLGAVLGLRYRFGEGARP